MSIKRSATGRSGAGGGGLGGKTGGRTGGPIDRQSLYDELKRLAGTGDGFTPVDVALSIGSSEAVIAKALLGLASTGMVERQEAGRYRATPMVEVSQAEFVKAMAQAASPTDSSRQRDLSEIGRLKQNNDIMRQRLLAVIAERDHYLAVLRTHGIDPGPVAAAPAAAGAGGTAAPLSRDSAQVTPGVPTSDIGGGSASGPAAIEGSPSEP